MVGRGWIKEDAALKQRPMKIRNHRADIARGVAASESAAPEPLQIVIVRHGKRVAIRFVHRIVLSLIGHPNVLMAQNIRANGRIESESVHTFADAINKDR